jgi:hypothetical protein
MISTFLSFSQWNGLTAYLHGESTAAILLDDAKLSLPKSCQEEQKKNKYMSLIKSLA